jgi:hypothetical protein
MDLINLKNDLYSHGDIDLYDLPTYPIYMFCDYYDAKHYELPEYLLYTAIKQVNGDIIIPKLVLYINFYVCGNINILSPFLVYFITTADVLHINNIPSTLMYICWCAAIEDYSQYLIYVKDYFINPKQLLSRYLKYVHVDEYDDKTSDSIDNVINLLDLLSDNNEELKRCKDIISNLNKHIPFVLKF